MGTSTSSSGPGAGVSFDPPWLDDVFPQIQPPAGAGPDTGDNADTGDNQTEEPADTTVTLVGIPNVAPRARFGAARRNLANYIGTGSVRDLRRALGHYSRKGMGGSTRLSKRMRASSAAGAGLYDLLNSVRNPTDNQIIDWVHNLTNRNLSVHEIADEILEKILPAGGSTEEESCRNAMADALSELIMENPAIDLLQMDDDSIWTVIEKYISNQAFDRLILDIGQVFENTRYSAREVVQRMNSMKEYLNSEIAVQLRRLRENNNGPSRQEMGHILQEAIRLTFVVFEGEI
jgi:hypothetical protein